MAYVTNDQLIARVGTAVATQLTTDSGSSPDATKITAARQAAEGLVNGYVSPQYATPLDLAINEETSQLIQGLVLDIGEYKLHSLRQPVSDGVTRLYDQAVATLTRISRGEITLPGAATQAGPTGRGTIADVDGAERIFDRDSMDGL